MRAKKAPKNATATAIAKLGIKAFNVAQKTHRHQYIYKNQ